MTQMDNEVNNFENKVLLKKLMNVYRVALKNRKQKENIFYLVFYVYKLFWGLHVKALIKTR